MNSENVYSEWPARSGNTTNERTIDGRKKKHFFRRCAKIKQTFNGNNENHNRRRCWRPSAGKKTQSQCFRYLKFICFGGCWCRRVSLSTPKNDCLVRPPHSSSVARWSATHKWIYLFHTELNCVSDCCLPHRRLFIQLCVPFRRIASRTTMMMTIITTTNIYIFGRFSGTNIFSSIANGPMRCEPTFRSPSNHTHKLYMTSEWVGESAEDPERPGDFDVGRVEHVNSKSLLFCCCFKIDVFAAVSSVWSYCIRRMDVQR